HTPNDGEPQIAGNGQSLADRVQETLGNIFMDIVCSHCGSDNVIRAGACGVCTECGTSQGCSLVTGQSNKCRLADKSVSLLTADALARRQLARLVDMRSRPATVRDPPFLVSG